MLLTTTRVRVTRPSSAGDPYEDTTETASTREVAAHISAPTAEDYNVGGHKIVVDAVLFVDYGTDLRASDVVTDVVVGSEYRVGWVLKRTGLGLDHIRAGLSLVSGGNSG